MNGLHQRRKIRNSSRLLSKEMRILVGYFTLIFIIVTRAEQQEQKQEQQRNETYLRNHAEERITSLSSSYYYNNNNNNNPKCPFQTPIAPEDLRFNKVNFPRYITKQDYLSLKHDHRNGNFLQMLKASNAVSVVTRDDYALEHEMIPMIQIFGTPSQPSSNPNSPFWDLLRHVLTVREYRLQDKSPTLIMPLPYTWKYDDIATCAENVFDEFPGLHQSNLITDFFERPQFYGKVKLDQSIIKGRSGAPFLSTIICLAELNTFFISYVGPHNFFIKWAFGRVRPEEVCWAIKHDCVDTSSIPNDIRLYCKQAPMQRPEDFTSYDGVGCPRHPSFPAMHSAASSISLWAAVVLDMTPVQRCQAKLVDFAVATARTIAGVHYDDDNIAGLNLGQELVARKLPSYLKERFNAKEEDVIKKIAKLRFDWRKFDRYDPCPELGYPYYKYYPNANDFESNNANNNNNEHKKKNNKNKKKNIRN